MMITNEPYMFDQCGKALPAWKRGGVDQQSSQLAIFSDERIDRLRDRLKVRGCESIPQLYHQHTSVPQELELEHGCPPIATMRLPALRHSRCVRSAAEPAALPSPSWPPAPSWPPGS